MDYISKYFSWLFGEYFPWLWGEVRDFLLHPDGPADKFILMAIAILLFVVVMGLILFLVDRPKNAPRWFVVVGFVGPAVLAIAFGLVYPALATMWSSLFNKNGSEFIGFDNYVTAVTQPAFQVVLRNTVLWIVLVPLLSTVLGLVYAVLVDRTRIEKLAKTLMFLPMAISMVGASIIWKFVYEVRGAENEQIGLLNQVLVWLGQDPKYFLIDSPWNNLFLIAIMVWIQTGFAMTILSAAIKAIPDDIVEAARLDGLSGVRMFRYITVPSIRPALVVVLTTIAMATLKVFDIVRTMTNGNYDTSVIANEFYKQSFQQANAGLGAALAVILFVFVIPLVIYNVRQMRLSEEIR